METDRFLTLYRPIPANRVVFDHEAGESIVVFAGPDQYGCYIGKGVHTGDLVEIAVFLPPRKLTSDDAYTILRIVEEADSIDAETVAALREDFASRCLIED